MRSAKPTYRIVLALGLVVCIAPLAFAQAKSPVTKATEPLKQKPAAPAAAAAAPAESAPSEQTPLPPGKRRDPFEPLVRRGPGAGQEVVPNVPGPGGLLVGTTRVDGVVRTPSGMIAVLANPQNRVYFVREGQKLYNGTVERITMDGVSFRERGKDAFGNPLDRVVVKRLYPSAGEQR